MSTQSTPITELRPIYQIASDIRKEWSKAKNGINYAAKPYLNALLSLSSIKDQYGMDSAREMVLYFLSNASSFRGGQAKSLKLELKQHLK
jgi:hypothetical protein